MIETRCDFYPNNFKFCAIKKDYDRQSRQVFS